MTIRLPDYSDEYLEELTVCACVDAPPPPEKLVLESIATDLEVWVQLIVNEQKTPKGVHVHVTTRRASLAKPTRDLVPMADLLSHLDVFLGRRMRFAEPIAEFGVPLDQFPNDHVVCLLLNVAALNESIRLSGATFSINEGPVDEIRWRLHERDGREMILCEVESVIEDVELTESYLVDALEESRDAFRSVILTETFSASQP